MLRMLSNPEPLKGYSSISPTFGNIPCNNDIQSTGVSPSFNLGTSCTAGFTLYVWGYAS